MSKIELYLSEIIKYGLYAILLTPLVFWPRALYAFMTPKFILFQVLVEIVFGAWVATQLLNNANNTNKYANDANRESQKNKLAISSISKNYILLALLCFTAISFISAFFGVDFSRSFWGIGARMTGLFAEFHFLAWLLVLISMSKSGVDFRSPTSKIPEVGLLKPDFDIVKYLNFSFAVSILVALSAFFQNPEWRLVFGSTFFNNPTFVAPYLLFHFFYGLYKFIGFRNLYFLGGSAFLFYIVLLTQIRGAILGLFAGLLISGILLIFSGVLSRRFKVSIIAIYLAIFLSLTGIWAFRDSSLVQNTSILKRLTQFSLSETTAQTRILTWQAALKGMKDNFWLGAGPENFNYVFNSHYNPALLKFSLGETWFDKPHNAFLEVLAEMGIIGGLAFALVWFAVGFLILKLWKNEKKLLSAFLSGAFISYIVALFFSFDSFGSWFGLYLFLAFLVLSGDNKEENFLNWNFSASAEKIMTFITALFVAYLILLNYSILRANVADADALRIFSQNQEAGLALFEKSLSYKSPYKSEYQFDLVASVGGAIEKGISLNNVEDTVNFVLGEADKAISAHPKSASGYTDMARIYNIFGTLGRDPGILAQAEQYGEKSLELSPNRQETLFYLARTALLRNMPYVAIEWTKQAVAADPTIGMSHWYLGLAYIADNQAEAGKAEIKNALKMGYILQNKTEENFVKNLGL